MGEYYNVVFHYCHFFYIDRTLLALGCHIVHGHPAAEEDLKKVKLPKKYVPYGNYYILSVTTGY